MALRKALVTGGTGVNGVWVVRLLLEQGIEPIVFDATPDLTFLKDVRDSFRLYRGDTRDLAAVLRAIKETRPDAILHLAALMPNAAQADPKTGFEVNALATVVMLEAARLGDIGKVVFTSSKGAYGDVTGDYAHPTYRPLDENFPPRPVNVYDVAKVASEGMGVNYWRNYGIDFVALRFATIFGPGKLARHGVLSIHGRMVENAMLGQPTRIARGADQRDDSVYVKDVAHSIVLAAQAEKTNSRIFHIGSGRTASLPELAAILKEIYPHAEIEIGPGLDYFELGHNVYSLHDITRARTELGYAPRYDLLASVKDYIATMKRFGVEPTPTA
ncbi:MAG: NAD-dependent epimerase/dehydratase family protein [Candidatus Binataceae bacterium]|nr:NAD-dependent epimerase/dehydratase family protein [Candidatus Binataceae bacterium]